MHCLADRKKKKIKRKRKKNAGFSETLTKKKSVDCVKDCSPVGTYNHVSEKES